MRIEDKGKFNDIAWVHATIAQAGDKDLAKELVKWHPQVGTYADTDSILCDSA